MSGFTGKTGMLFGVPLRGDKWGAVHGEAEYVNGLHVRIHGAGIEAGQSGGPPLNITYHGFSDMKKEGADLVGTLHTFKVVDGRLLSIGDGPKEVRLEWIDGQRTW